MYTDICLTMERTNKNGLRRIVYLGEKVNVGCFWAPVRAFNRVEDDRGGLQRYTYTYKVYNVNKNTVYMHKQAPSLYERVFTVRPGNVNRRYLKYA